MATTARQLPSAKMMAPSGSTVSALPSPAGRGSGEGRRFVLPRGAPEEAGGTAVRHAGQASRHFLDDEGAGTGGEGDNCGAMDRLLTAVDMAAEGVAESLAHERLAPGVEGGM